MNDITPSDAAVAPGVPEQTVAAVVVTYNRKNLLDECLQALLQQTRPVDSIILIDNASTDGTPEFLREKGYLDNPKVDYVRLPENTGGAGGFHEGVKRGYEKCFDWLWLMDDDCEPDPAALEQMQAFIGKQPGVLSFVSPLICSPNGKVQWWHHKQISPTGIMALESNPIPKGADKCSISKPVEINANGFCGPLINGTLIRDCGLPEKAYFIYCDDAEYTFRLSRKGPGFVVPRAIMYHKDGANQFGHQSKGNQWKVYYGMRNLILASRNYVHGPLRIGLFTVMTYILVRRLLGIVVRKRAGAVRLAKFLLAGYVDGLRGVTGMTIKP